MRGQSTKQQKNSKKIKRGKTLEAENAAKPIPSELFAIAKRQPKQKTTPILIGKTLHTCLPETFVVLRGKFGLRKISMTNNSFEINLLMFLHELAKFDLKLMNRIELQRNSNLDLYNSRCNCNDCIPPPLVKSRGRKHFFFKQLGRFACLLVFS